MLHKLGTVIEYDGFKVKRVSKGIAFDSILKGKTVIVSLVDMTPSQSYIDKIEYADCLELSLDCDGDVFSAYLFWDYVYTIFAYLRDNFGTSYTYPAFWVYL